MIERGLSTQKSWVLWVDVAWIEWSPAAGDLAAFSSGLSHEMLRDCSWHIEVLSFTLVLNVSFHIVVSKCLVVCGVVQTADTRWPKTASRGKAPELDVRGSCALLSRGAHTLLNTTCLWATSFALLWACWSPGLLYSTVNILRVYY